MSSDRGSVVSPQKRCTWPSAQGLEAAAVLPSVTGDNTLACMLAPPRDSPSTRSGHLPFFTDKCTRTRRQSLPRDESTIGTTRIGRRDCPSKMTVSFTHRRICSAKYTAVVPVRDSIRGSESVRPDDTEPSEQPCHPRPSLAFCGKEDRSHPLP